MLEDSSINPDERISAVPRRALEKRKQKRSAQSAREKPNVDGRERCCFYHCAHIIQHPLVIDLRDMHVSLKTHQELRVIDNGINNKQKDNNPVGATQSLFRTPCCQGESAVHAAVISSAQVFFESILGDALAIVCPGIRLHV